MIYQDERQKEIINKIGLNNTYWDSAKTILSYCNAAYQHIHQQSHCYPTLANGITIIGGVGSWDLGNKTELIPASAIATAFDIHYVVFEGASATDTYEIVLYSGENGSEIEIGRIRADRESATSGVSNSAIQIPVQNANTRISCAIASKSGGNDTLTISVHYHTYQ